jgi:16S rRNA (cytosine967-C5)-methyltransferase
VAGAHAGRETIAEDARTLALRLLTGVLERGKTLAEQEDESPFTAAVPAERARAGRLARATLRKLGQADAVLAPLLRRPPRADIRTVLRLGTVEILEEGAAPHGVVNACVDLARLRQARAAGMVNAILRRVAETEREVWAALPPQRLPGWLRGRLSSAYGNARATRIEAVCSAPAPLDLTLRDNRRDWAERLEADVLPTGTLRRRAGGQVSALPGFAEGAWWVQDAAAALPARALAPSPGQRVLDLCAAPGGKTLQLAATGAEVTALDVSDSRLDRLRDNLARTGLAAQIVTADALEWAPEAPFDAILLDAPCSATGTLRRHPDLPFVRKPEDLKPLATLQSALLDRATGWLRPGGRLVFCTCSLLPEEGEAVVADALARHPGLAPDPAAIGALPGLEAAWDAGPGTLRITPETWEDRGGLDGFYVAALRREP